MRALLVALAVVVLPWVAFGVLAAGTTWTSPPFETPLAPLSISSSGTFAELDVQVHNRASATGFPSFGAQHGANCSAPPATHAVATHGDAVYVCNSHVMTALNGGPTSYAMAAITPAQVLDCAVSCTVQWEVSTERMSTRDWWDIWLTPWAENLTLPVPAQVLDVDLQGGNRNGLMINTFNPGAPPVVSVRNNGAETNLTGSQPVDAGIQAGVNESATRQAYKLTVTPGRVRFERLASATASAIVFVDANAPVQMRNDYVVQFAHHSYDPEKDGAGVPATWHWNSFALDPATPFTLIKGSGNINGNGSTTGIVTFPQPAPANAYLRFTGLCGVRINGTLVNKQQFLGHGEHAGSYFVPIAAGTTSVNVAFALEDGWYGQPWHDCRFQGASIWAKGGTPPSTPTPSPIPISPTATVAPITPTPTATSIVVPSPTATMPSATPSSTPSPTQTSTPIRRTCTLRWGNNSIESYGNLTQAECAARGG